MRLRKLGGRLNTYLFVTLPATDIYIQSKAKLRRMMRYSKLSSFFSASTENMICFVTSSGVYIVTFLT